MKHVLECEGFEEAFPCLSAAGLADIRAFKSVGPRRSGGVLSAIGSEPNSRALRYARNKCRNTDEGLPCDDAEFLARLTAVCRAIQLREQELSLWVAGSPKIGGRSLSGVEDTPRPASAEPETKTSKSEKDRAQADQLLCTVEAQNHSRLPMPEYTPSTGDVLVAHDQLKRKPPRAAGLGALSLRSRQGSATDEGSRHKSGKKFKHSRGETPEEEQEFLKWWMLVHAHGGAFEVDLTYTTAERVDLNSGVRQADGEEDAVLMSLYPVVRDYIDQAREAIVSLGNDGGKARRYVDLVVEGVDSEFAVSPEFTFTQALGIVMKRRHEGQLGGKSRHRYDLNTSSSSDTSDSDDSDTPPKRRKRKKSTSPKDKKNKDKGAKRARKSGRNPHTKPTGICFAWAKKQITRKGAGCSKSNKDCRFEHSFTGKDRKWCEHEYGK